MSSETPSHLPARYSKFIGCCLLCLGLLACGQRAGGPHNEASALLDARRLAAFYGEMASPYFEAYTAQLWQRLAWGALALRDGSITGHRAQFTLLNTPEPAAFSPSPQLMLVSRGLIAMLENEAQFAFVLAHEMAHHLLEHEPLQDSGSAALRREMEADYLALKIVLSAGFDPHAAARALALRYETTHPAHAADTRARYAALVEKLRALPPQTLATRDRRSFQQLRQSLR